MNVPKLRFKEFSGEWETISAKDLFENISEKNFPAETVLTIIQGQGTIPRSESGRDISFDEKSTSNYKKVLKNDFIIHLRSFEAGLEVANSTGIVSPAYTVLRSKETIGVSFYRNYFRSNKFINQTLCSAVEGVRDGRQIRFEQFKNIPLVYTKLEEQEKISAFLNVVDEKIVNQKAIVKSLEKQKKGLMQKIFSQELRFKDDKGEEFPAWEEKLIKEVCSISTGKSNTQDKVDDGVYPFYVRSSVVEKSDKYLYDEEAVLTVGDGVGTGKIYHYVNGKYDLHQRVYRMYDFVGVSAKYFYFYFSSHFYDRVSKMSAKNSVDSVRLNMIADMRISVPCMGEQTKIVEVLTGVERQATVIRNSAIYIRRIFLSVGLGVYFINSSLTK